MGSSVLQWAAPRWQKPAEQSIPVFDVRLLSRGSETYVDSSPASRTLCVGQPGDSWLRRSSQRGWSLADNDVWFMTIRRREIGSPSSLATVDNWLSRKQRHAYVRRVLTKDHAMTNARWRKNRALRFHQKNRSHISKRKYKTNGLQSDQHTVRYVLIGKVIAYDNLYTTIYLL